MIRRLSRGAPRLSLRMEAIEMGTCLVEVIDTIMKVKKEQEKKLATCEPSMHQYYGARIGVLTELLERIETLY